VSAFLAPGDSGSIALRRIPIVLALVALALLC
jgi:hypothetical protein